VESFVHDPSDYVDRTKKQVVLGNFTEEATVMGTIIQVGAGVFNVDLPADVRDLSADVMNWEWSKSHIKQTIFDGIGLLPIIGAFKYGDEAADVVKSGSKTADKMDDVKDVGKGVVKGGSNANLGSKTDYLFGKATGNKHNIERSKAMQAELKKIGIYDNQSGREYISKHLNDVLKDSTNINNVETRTYIAKELPGQPVVKYTATTRESLLMGPGGAVKVESVWDGNRLITVVIKGGN
jgi:hypothetical protein